MFKLINFVFFILFYFSSISFAEDSLNIITTKLKKGDTFYKVFSEMKINKLDANLFIASLQRKLDLKRMPTGQKIKFYFLNSSNVLIAVAVPLKNNVNVLTWRKDDNISSSKISDNLLNDRVKAIINSEDFIPKPGLHRIIVSRGDNLTKLLSNASVSIGEIQNIIQVVSEVLDLRKLRPNDVIELLYIAKSEGVFLDKVILTMSGKNIIIKKDSFQVFRIKENEKSNNDANIKDQKTIKKTIVNQDLILGQLREFGWSRKEAREALDAFSTVYDPQKINKNTEVIFPNDRRVKAFSIMLDNNSMILVQEIKNGDFLAQKLTSKKAKAIISNLKITEKSELSINKENIKKNKNNETAQEIKADDLYFKTNLIEGKISKGDTLISRLLALGEKQSTIMMALKSLSKKMNPDLVRAGSTLIVALDRTAKPMRGFFITKKQNDGYLVILDKNIYTVTKSNILKAKIELAKLVKPNLIERKKNIEIIPEWKDSSLVKPFKYNVKIFTFKRGDTLSHAFSSINVSERDNFGFINKLQNEFDPRKIKIGNKMKLYLNKEDPKLVEGIALHLDKVKSIEVFKINNNYILNKYKEPVIITFHKVSGEINNSLYISAKKAGLPISVLMEVVKIYSFDVDFQREIKSGDAFEVLYQIYNNKSGEVVRNGPVLRSVLVLGGERLPLYRYEYEKDYFDYFDSEANSARKALMRTPLDGARISSVFGKRKHPILGYTKMHKGVDFAAPRNTPVFAAGDGVIEYAKRNGGYGEYIRIRHNSEYKTAYAHLARFAESIRQGKRVKQGDIIGYVGTTGRSTGPHLHYEIIFRNKQVNPLKVRMPKELKLNNEDYDSFIIERNKLDNIWDSL
ncbi:MAG: Murein DD-endopeptidase MepM [Alphaproteobacteria bacterium MarineAlpha9_Bin3]|nr:MAG: Murein DD-endopeptidase MepM [Alphaproteobacteria bacterium MarineAlpha9_Bin3]